MWAPLKVYFLVPGTYPKGCHVQFELFGAIDLLKIVGIVWIAGTWPIDTHKVLLMAEILHQFIGSLSHYL